jgi:hypothetical protein
MRLPVVIKLLLALVVCAAGLRAQTRILTVDPDTAKPGATVTANGEGIDKTAVDTLYLTDGSNDFKCEVLEQTAKSIRFKVPADMKKGRWALMVHTSAGQLLQQPVKLNVE